MEKTENIEVAPDRKRYAISEITKIYLEARKTDSLRFNLRRLGEEEVLDLVEILHTIIEFMGGKNV